jgi:hypothetical protein
MAPRLSGERRKDRGEGVSMKRLLLLTVMAVLIPACTHYYVKPGRTTADFNRDKRECEKVAEKEAARKGTRTCDESEKCLLAKGWQRD